MSNIDSQILSDRARAEDAAIRAKESELEANQYVIDSGEAKDLAIEAKDLAVGARNAAQEAQGDAEDAKGIAVGAKNIAVEAKEDAILAREDSIEAKEDSIEAKNIAVSAKEDAVSAKNIAVSAKEDAVSAKNIAVSAKEDAVSAKEDSEEARDIAVGAKEDSEDARDLSIQARNESVGAKDIAVEAKDIAVEAKEDSIEAKDISVNASIEAVNAVNKISIPNSTIIVDGKHTQNQTPVFDNIDDAVVGAYALISGGQEKVVIKAYSDSSGVPYKLDGYDYYTLQDEGIYFESNFDSWQTYLRTGANITNEDLLYNISNESLSFDINNFYSIEDYITNAERAKLSGIEDGATKNATDAQLRSRATHTGVQPISSVTDLQNSLDSKVDKQIGYGLSQENYTPAEKSKLSSIEGSKFKGEYVSLSALEAAQPSPEVGSYAYVDIGVGEVVTKYIWDSSDAEWAKQQGETSSLTPSEVKSLYEENPNTNTFTDSEKTKLTGVQAGAEVNDINTVLTTQQEYKWFQFLLSGGNVENKDYSNLLLNNNQLIFNLTNV